MNFALLGDHPDGLDMARTVAESDKHQLLVYSGPTAGVEWLRRRRIVCEVAGDIEEVLANPAIDAVIGGGSSATRFAQVRRALQAEKHVLSAHPLDASPDAGYEADLQRRESGVVLLPLLSAEHPAIRRLASLIVADRSRDPSTAVVAEQPLPPPPFPSGQRERAEECSPQLIQIERWSTDSPYYGGESEAGELGFPDWDVLRYLGGEIVEISAFADGERATALEALAISGRFEAGGMFQTILLPAQQESRWRLTVFLADDRAELVFDDGWPGPASLSYCDENGERKEQSWPSWNPWPRLLEAFESAVSESSDVPSLSWLDEVRCLELDDAVRRSVERRRSSVLEYQEAVEEAGFKGTMTLVGCGMLWLSLFLLIVAIWVPHIALLILPLLAIFLFLQLLRWFAFPAGRG